MSKSSTNSESTTFLVPALTPNGRLLLENGEEAAPLNPDFAHRVQEAFTRGHGHGLLQLGAAEVHTVMPPVFVYWREFSARYVTAVCTMPDAETIPPPLEDLDSIASAAPPMTGAEYLTSPVLEGLWTAIDAAFRLELSESKGSVQEFLNQKNPAWNLVGRVHFNLAENRKDENAPFAFLATYTIRTRESSTRAARRSAQRIRRRSEQIAAAFLACAGAARSRAMRVA